MDKINVSTLRKTWIFDIDGTIVKHNGYKIDGKDSLIYGIKEYFDKNIHKEDMVILITSRLTEYKAMTEAFLKENGIRFDQIIYNLPYGERILINDVKPSGLKTSIAINTKRDMCVDTIFVENQDM